MQQTRTETLTNANMTTATATSTIHNMPCSSVPLSEPVSGDEVGVGLFSTVTLSTSSVVSLNLTESAVLRC